ncbi:MAG: hypothetical protein KME64_25145 [Scytonematopsis contorta HA4267-MV1]|jgi:hypothetical protein|nr:hypothetical protein [Scytonematopsis contorta HA4267-MV1]
MLSYLDGQLSIFIVPHIKEAYADELRSEMLQQLPGVMIKVEYIIYFNLLWFIDT